MDKELLRQLKEAQMDEQVAELGFKCIGNINNVYPFLPAEILENMYRTWIWENESGLRVAFWDKGNSYCDYMCIGTEEELVNGNHYDSLSRG